MAFSPLSEKEMVEVFLDLSADSKDTISLKQKKQLQNIFVDRAQEGEMDSFLLTQKPNVSDSKELFFGFSNENISWTYYLINLRDLFSAYC